MKKSFIPLGFLLLSLLLFGCDSSAEETAGRDWGEFLGGPCCNQYSTLEQMNRSNVNRLQIAWEYHTQDSWQMQCNPLIVDGVLYGLTASTKPFAVDAAMGKVLWKGAPRMPCSTTPAGG